MSLQLRTLSLHQLQSRDPADGSRVAQVIRDAFGPTGSGIFLVNALSEQFAIDRANLLAAGRALSALPEQHLRQLENKQLDYCIGWSRGHESFKGVIDTNKGSFYANPVYDEPAEGDPTLTAKYPHQMSRNVWPTHPSCSGVEQCFKGIGRYVNDIGLHVARHCDKFVREKLGTKYQFSSLEESLRTSRNAKGRLLIYFPPDTDAQSSAPACDITNDLWCGYHNDHGTLTGLIAGQFYTANDQKPLSSVPDSRTGLYVHRRDSSKAEKVVIPADCIAFQIGETAQIMTGGVLHATPHAVLMPKTNIANVSRVTLAVFLQPNPWESLEMPQNYSPEESEAALETSDLVPSLRSGRYMQGDLFNDFAGKTIKAYCK